MEPRFGFDFRNVRIHDDPERVRDLDAVAYTTGQDIGFAPGRYQPHTPWGQALIAHELAHVTQQAGHPGSPQAPVSAPDEAAEQAADTAATVFPVGADRWRHEDPQVSPVAGHPQPCRRALRRQHARQAGQRDRAGDNWQDNDLVFASQVGTEMDRHNVLRGFRRILKAAGLNPDEWTPRELRHSFVSLLSDAKVPIEVISRLVGHSGTAVTERVYRHQIRPVVEEAATEMDRIFPDNDPAA
jgi:hypothetical protein